MMKLKVLGSSSTGNGYLLCNGEEAIVLEAGVSLLQLKKALDFQIQKIQGCLVSHSHKDHCRYVKPYADAGIDILGPGEIFDSLHNRFHKIFPKKGYKLGNFKVLAFPLLHDTTCYGYLIDHPDTGRIAFITDTYLCEYVFPGLHHIIIEANYADDILEENIMLGIERPAKRERLLTSHMEIKSTKAFLKAQDLSQVRSILLIHLSDTNSHARRFHHEITVVTGKQVYVAYPGLQTDLTNPF